MKFIDPKNIESILTQRFSSNKRPLASNYISPPIAEEFKQASRDYQMLFTQLIEGEGCQIKGYLPIEKAPGSLHFFIDENRYGDLRRRLGDRQIPEISFTHDVKMVTFGDLKDQKEMIKVFGKSSVTEFNRADYMPAQTDVNFCLYYFPLVPHMFSLGKEAINKETYQYSIVYNCQEAPIRTAAYQITFAYHLNPVGIYYNKEEFALLQMFTSVAAIVTGIYVIMGIIKKTLDNLI